MAKEVKAPEPKSREKKEHMAKSIGPRMVHKMTMTGREAKEHFANMHNKLSVREQFEKKYGDGGKSGHFDEKGGWHGKNAHGGKFESGFGGRDNS